MSNKIDINSLVFQEEYQKTTVFTDKVCERFGFVYNADEEINESIKIGLTRNKLIYGKRYCPCFMVVEKTLDNRLCPCKPALLEEIPRDGHCHCGIFCTEKFAEQGKDSCESDVKLDKIEHNKDINILKQNEIRSCDLEVLLSARENGDVDFILVDTREPIENQKKQIIGTNFLIPTTSFYDSVQQIKDYKEANIVLYCFSGSRSSYCQQVMKKMGYQNVINLQGGIYNYKGGIKSS